MSVKEILLFTFCLSFASLFLFRKLAQHVGLVDKPNERKQHSGSIPLVGGISVFISAIATFVFFYKLNTTREAIYFCAIILLFIGVLDDRFDISVKFRILVQFAIALFMVFVTGKKIQYFGNFIGGDAIFIDRFSSVVVTMVAVTATINAFNMVDGIDGLLGGLTCVTCTALAFVFAVNGERFYFIMCAVIVAALLPYIMLNMGIPFGKKYKVFMGDAGSMVIGFIVIWLTIQATQFSRIDHDIEMRPEAALWIMAVPIMDMITVIIRRISTGRSPFQADREHLHHICLRLGLSSNQAMVSICALAFILAVIGILGEIYRVHETSMFCGFLVVFAGYFVAKNYAIRGLDRKELKIA